jgi:hypothetical protein
MQAGKELVPVSYGDGGTKAMALERAEITEQIIGAAFDVYSILGYDLALGFVGRCRWGLRKEQSSQVAVTKTIDQEFPAVDPSLPCSISVQSVAQMNW